MRLLVGIIASILLASAVVAQGLPQDVADAYRAYEAAVDGEDWAAAAYQAERAWRAAEAGEVDDATTTVLAANYGEVALINGNNAAAAEAYERAADLGETNSEPLALATYLISAAQAYHATANHQRAIVLADAAIEVFGALPEGEGHFGGLYQANRVIAYASNASGNQRRSGVSAERALHAMAYFGPVSNPDVAQLAFLAGNRANSRGDHSTALYYLLVSRFISRDLAMDPSLREAALTLQQHVMAATDPRDFDEVYDRIRSSGYAPGECDTRGVCPDRSVDADKGPVTQAEGIVSDPPQVEYSVVPLLRTPPRYPAAAAERGTNGYVDVVFRVSETGRVENVVVVESSSHMFNTAAINAVRQWRYWPRQENGVDVPREGVRTRLDFMIED